MPVNVECKDALLVPVEARLELSYINGEYRYHLCSRIELLLVTSTSSCKLPPPFYTNPYCSVQHLVIVGYSPLAKSSQVDDRLFSLI